MKRRLPATLPDAAVDSSPSARLNVSVRHKRTGLRFVLRRVAFYLLTAWAALSLNFFIPKLMPGNPVQALAARFRGEVSPGAFRSFALLFGLNAKSSIWSQYGAYFAHLADARLGISFSYYPSTVSQVIITSLPWTVVLVGVTTVLGFVIGTLLGIAAGWWRGSIWLDGLLPLTTFLSSIPYFWFGLLCILFFAVDLHWFPLSGGYAPTATIGLNWAFIGTAAYHSILPGMTIIFSSIGGWMLGMRNMMITTQADDYVLMAEARGLPERRIIVAYAARNAFLPSLASFAMSLGFVVSGAILVEIVFSYPGIGYVLYQAVTNEDYPLMQGVFLIITLAVLVANLVADVVYVLLDPRTRQG